MKRYLTALVSCALILVAQQAFSQSTNGEGDPEGRENWVPNRGNVGIGTRTPTHNLHVIGNVLVTETLFTTNLETVGLKAKTLTITEDASIGRHLFVNGNVGIGVPNPTERLDIAGNLKVSHGIFGDELTVRAFTATDGTVNNTLGVGSDFHVGGLTGLGVTSPTERLDVNGNIKATGTLFSDIVSSGDATFSRNLTVSQNANVTQNFLVNGLTGLGVTAPTERLDVNGNIKATGTLFSDIISSGDATFSRNLVVSQNANVTQNLIVSGLTGLGVTAPTERFEVAGNIKATQGLMASSADLSGNFSAGGTGYFAGNVGVGAAPDAHRLNVAGDGYINGLLTAENLTVKQKLDIKGTFSLAGTLGIGVAEPTAALDVNGDGQFSGDIRANKIIVNAIEIAGASETPEEGTNVSLGDNLFVNGSVGIGTEKITGYKLSVNGKIRASDDIRVYLESEWSDFVFENNYKLAPLSEVEAFIKSNKHLPGIPSAKNVKEEGIDLGAMDAKLLQKIEELTLYLIEIKKENESLRKEVNTLKGGRKQ